MKKKNLLYIDILGFTALAKKPHVIQRIFFIIENLNCHNHDAFNVIVFSDTILIYPNFDPFTEQDEQYVVMFLIEFAQNLFYELVGLDIYFRAIIVHGEFEHTQPRNIPRFFGQALIDAYNLEKNMKCMGVFITDEVNKNNRIFETTKMESGLYFTFINQNLKDVEDSLSYQEEPEFENLYQTSAINFVAADFIYLSQIYKYTKKDIEENIKVKHLNTYNLYKSKYPLTLAYLESANFDLKSLTKHPKWKQAVKTESRQYRGYNLSDKGIESFISNIPHMLDIGKSASIEVLKKRFGDEYEIKYALPCGGASIILDIDSRSKFGKKLLATPEIVGVRIRPHFSKKGISISFYGAHNRQELFVDEHCHQEILKEIVSMHWVEAYVETYID